MFRRWIRHPLRHDIRDRQQSIADIRDNSALRGGGVTLCCLDGAECLAKLFKGSVDIERLVTRVHVGNCRLAAFLDLLDALDKVVFFILFELTMQIEKIMSEIQSYLGDVQSPRFVVTIFGLARCQSQTALSVGSLFPDLSAPLLFFRQAFDRTEARGQGLMFSTTTLVDGRRHSAQSRC